MQVQADLSSNILEDSSNKVSVGDLMMDLVGSIISLWDLVNFNSRAGKEGSLTIKMIMVTIKIILTKLQKGISQVIAQIKVVENTP